jgi:ribosome-binding protein aMBF1 (putative translation factor)
MTKPLQTFTTPAGDELVVLTRADYELLLEQAAANDDEEDAELIALADARMADPTISEKLPADVSRLLLSGASLLKALREWRQIGQVRLADEVGTSQGFISDLENGRRTMTTDVRSRLASALDIPEHWLG